MSNAHEENRPEQQPWPPAPEGSNAHVLPVKTKINAKEIAAGAALGLVAGIGFTVIVVEILFWTLPAKSITLILLFTPFVLEYFLTRWLWGRRRTIGQAFGIVSMTISTLAGIAFVLFALALSFPD